MFDIKRHERLEFKDGFSVSVQASRSAYCTPRRDESLFGYTEVELGFPSEEEELLTPYAEIGGEGVDYTKQVYPYTPASVALSLIEKHGEIVAGTHPTLKSRPNRVWVKVSQGGGFDAEVIKIINLSKIEDEYEDSSYAQKRTTFAEYLDDYTQKNYKELSEEGFDLLAKHIMRL
jgi:hypothetical protein